MSLLFHRLFLAQIVRKPFRNTKNIYRFSSTKTRVEDVVDLDQPIKFTTSKAIEWKAEQTRQGAVNTRLWYEPYVIMVSLSVFMIYFTILREESDVDLELNRSLYSRIEGLEEYQLRLSLEYNTNNGLPTADIEKRLKEIEEEKKN